MWVVDRAARMPTDFEARGRCCLLLGHESCWDDLLGQRHVRAREQRALLAGEPVVRGAQYAGDIQRQGRPQWRDTDDARRNAPRCAARCAISLSQ